MRCQIYFLLKTCVLLCLFFMLSNVEGTGSEAEQEPSANNENQGVLPRIQDVGHKISSNPFIDVNIDISGSKNLKLNARRCMLFFLKEKNVVLNNMLELHDKIKKTLAFDDVKVNRLKIGKRLMFINPSKWIENFENALLKEDESVQGTLDELRLSRTQVFKILNDMNTYIEFLGMNHMKKKSTEFFRLKSQEFIIKTDEWNISIQIFLKKNTGKEKEGESIIDSSKSEPSTLKKPTKYGNLPELYKEWLNMYVKLYWYKGTRAVCPNIERPIGYKLFLPSGDLPLEVELISRKLHFMQISKLTYDTPSCKKMNLRIKRKEYEEGLIASKKYLLQNLKPSASEKRLRQKTKFFFLMKKKYKVLFSNDFTNAILAEVPDEAKKTKAYVTEKLQKLENRYEKMTKFINDLMLKSHESKLKHDLYWGSEIDDGFRFTYTSLNQHFSFVLCPVLPNNEFRAILNEDLTSLNVDDNQRKIREQVIYKNLLQIFRYHLQLQDYLIGKIFYDSWIRTCNPFASIKRRFSRFQRKKDRN